VKGNKSVMVIETISAESTWIMIIILLLESVPTDIQWCGLMPSHPVDNKVIYPVALKSNFIHSLASMIELLIADKLLQFTA